MGNCPNRPTWVNFSNAVVLFSALALLCQCGSGGPDTNLQQGPTAILRIDGPATHEFGIREVGSFNPAAFKIKNKGSAIATEITGSFNLSIAYSFQGGEFPGTDGTCTETLGVQEQCTIFVVFSPPSASKYESPMSISYFNGASKALLNEPLLKGQGN